MGKLTDFFKKWYYKLKFEKIAITAVLVTQALKRILTSKYTVFLLDLVPLPWLSTITKIMYYLTKATDVVPLVLTKMVLTKGLIDTAEISEKEAIAALIKYTEKFTKEELTAFYKEFALEVSYALDDDGIISPEERAEIMEKMYNKMFKK